MLGDAPTAHEVFIERFSKRHRLWPGCSESTTYGGRDARLRAKSVSFGSNCSPVVPQLSSGFPKSTDFPHMDVYARFGIIFWPLTRCLAKCLLATSIQS